jgi:hypothetical protein
LTGNGSAPVASATPTTSAAIEEPARAEVQKTAPNISISVTGFVGDESVLASQLGRVFRQAVGDDVDFGLATA